MPVHAQSASHVAHCRIAPPPGAVVGELYCTAAEKSAMHTYAGVRRCERNDTVRIRRPTRMRPPRTPWRPHPARTNAAASSDEAVHQVLEHLLAPGLRLGIDVVRYRPVGNPLERGALRVNLLAELAVPLRVALLDELVDAAVLDERRRRQQRTGQ